VFYGSAMSEATALKDQDIFIVGAGNSAGNCHARAYVVIGDETILNDVPVTFLMNLEHQLTEIVSFFRALQVNDPAKDWVRDRDDQS
jgi:hypothetical protein